MSAIPVATDLSPTPAPALIAVGYLYVNPAAPQGDGASLAEQQGIIETYARVNGMALPVLVHETAASISTRSQPMLERLIQGESCTPWDVLLVARLDRLTREVGELSSMFSRIHSHPGRYLVSISEGIDTRQESGRFCAHLVQIFSRWDMAAIPDRTRAWVMQKRTRGEPIGHAPYGYVYANKVLVEVRAEQAVIGLIRELREKPLSYEKIARYLNARNIPSKRGGGWYPETVKAVFCRLTTGPAVVSTPLQPGRAAH